MEMTQTTRHGELWVLGSAWPETDMGARCGGMQRPKRHPCPIVRPWGSDAWAVLRLKGTSSSIQNGGHSFRTLRFISVEDIKGLCRKTMGEVALSKCLLSCADNRFGRKLITQPKRCWHQQRCLKNLCKMTWWIGAHNFDRQLATFS